ncbi:hypothetical protein Q1695_008878 [Nippostrongylus brasiliensis]|nr:hypothetical protein Q1695_008878 [Nippostrongylus brasiliensis]
MLSLLVGERFTRHIRPLVFLWLTVPEVNPYRLIRKTKDGIYFIPFWLIFISLAFLAAILFTMLFVSAFETRRLLCKAITRNVEYDLLDFAAVDPEWRDVGKRFEISAASDGLQGDAAVDPEWRDVGKRFEISAASDGFSDAKTQSSKSKSKSGTGRSAGGGRSSAKKPRLKTAIKAKTKESAISAKRNDPSAKRLDQSAKRSEYVIASKTVDSQKRKDKSSRRK